MAIELRKYQAQAVSEVRLALGRYRKVMLQAACGFGKTVCFSYIASKTIEKGHRVLILSDRCEILTQNGGALEEMGIQVEYVTPKNKKVPTGMCIVCMAQTLRRRIEKQEWIDWLQTVDFVVIDEAHSCSTDFVHPYLRENVWLLGCSATPARRSHQKQLCEIYRAMVTTISTKELIAQGYLAKSNHYSIIAPSLDGLNIDSGTGDYNRKQLAMRFENKAIYTGIVDEYMRLTPHKRAICFCVSAKQAIEQTKIFNERGISAKYVLSGSFDSDDTYSGKRSDVFQDFKDHKFEVLVNVGVAVAGFDQKDIEVVILNFATVSITRYLQATGRGSRVTETKHEFTVLDAGRNFAKFGVYEADRQWSLQHDEHSSSGVMAMKICDTTKKDCNGHYGCGRLVPTTLKVCKECGYVFRTAEYEYQLHLEKVEEESEAGSIEEFVVQKRQLGWKLNRICVQVGLKDPDNAKRNCMKAYLACSPGKTEADARKFWFMFDKTVWQNIKHKRNSEDSSPKLF